jgi:hypothetical protein
LEVVEIILDRDTSPGDSRWGVHQEGKEVSFMEGGGHFLEVEEAKEEEGAGVTVLEEAEVMEGEAVEEEEGESQTRQEGAAITSCRQGQVQWQHNRRLLSFKDSQVRQGLGRKHDLNRKPLESDCIVASNLLQSSVFASFHSCTIVYLEKYFTSSTHFSPVGDTFMQKQMQSNLSRV